jgi:hypothetical protein
MGCEPDEPRSHSDRRAPVLTCVRHPIAPSFLQQSEITLAPEQGFSLRRACLYFYETFESTEVQSHPHG